MILTPGIEFDGGVLIDITVYQCQGMALSTAVNLHLRFSLFAKLTNKICLTNAH